MTDTHDHPPGLDLASLPLPPVEGTMLAILAVRDRLIIQVAVLEGRLEHERQGNVELVEQLQVEKRENEFMRAKLEDYSRREQVAAESQKEPQ